MKSQLALQVRFGCFMILLSVLNSSLSAQITESLPGNISVNADFRQGEADRPAVFLLHGFMATHNLNIIQIMADELESQGYTILAPTLSLKINNRHSGANCEAVHTHTMESDVAEIGWWFDWLKHKGYKEVIAVGFSTGSLQLAIYLSRQSPEIIKKAMFISPAYLAGPPFAQAEEKAEMEVAKQMLARHDDQLHEFHLSYCKGNFIAPAKVFLSYKEWTDTKLLEAIQGVGIPNVSIIGGGDHRFGTGLSKKLKSNDLALILVPEANHFFDSPYEFDFLDKFMQEVCALSTC